MFADEKSVFSGSLDLNKALFKEGLSMKSAVAAVGLLLGTVQAGMADPCHDRFVELYKQLDQGVPTKTFVTTAFKGAPPMTNDFLYLNHDHHMSVPIDPPQAWVLTYRNVMYQSSDEGKSWAKVRDLDASQNAEGAIAAKAENAKTIRNAACGTEEIDGVAHDTLEADLTVSQGMVTENHYKYWVRPDDGFIVKAAYDTKAPNFEMAITQVIEKAPDLKLPTPE